MFTKRIIPCLDVNNGRVVKGEFCELKDGDPGWRLRQLMIRPVRMKLSFWISASSDGRNTVVDLVRRVAEKVFIPFTVGGGIRTVDDFPRGFAGRCR